MNNLKNSTTYLAGNLEHSSDSVSWRDYITEELKNLEIKALNPRIQCFTNQLSEDQESVEYLKGFLENKQYDAVHGFMKQIIRRDLRMVDRADFLIVNLEPEKPTTGTIHEIVIASLQRKPILVRLDDISKLSLWLCGLLDFETVFEKWSDLMSYLSYIDTTAVDQLNNKYWKFWKNE